MYILTSGIDTAHQGYLGQRSKACPISYLDMLVQKLYEDEDSSYKLYKLVTYIPVTTWKNLQTINVDENCWLSNKVKNCPKINFISPKEDEGHFILP